MIVFLYIWLFISAPIVLVSFYYLFRFARIILLFEEDIANTLDSLEDVERAMAGVIEMKMFFDDIKIKEIVKNVMDEVKMAKHSVNIQAKALIDRSKQKYIIIEEIEAPPENLPGVENQPEERTLLHVGHQE